MLVFRCVSAHSFPEHQRNPPSDTVHLSFSTTGAVQHQTCNWLICHVIAQHPRPGQLCALAQNSDQNNWPFSTHGQTSKPTQAALKLSQPYMRPSIKECGSLFSSLQNSERFYSFSQHGIKLMKNKNK